MHAVLSKIIRTPQTTLPKSSITAERAEILEVGSGIQKRIKDLFKGSLAIREVDAGSDNAAEQEIVALSNTYYDIERFGVRFVASPRHADLLLVTGPVSRNMAEALRRAYNATPAPKIVVAVGDDAIDGGIFKNSYAVEGGVNTVIPVDYGIAGDPPSPLTIMRALLLILNDMADKRHGGAE